MSFNLLDVVKGHLNSDVLNQAASFLGEDGGKVGKAMDGIVPTLLSGLASKASSSEGAHEVANMASEAHNSGILGNLGSFFGGGDILSKGVDLVKGLFGGKASGIIDAVSSVAGIKSSSAGSLMGMALPVALGALGKHSADNNLGATGIASLLSGGASSWTKLLPAGLGNLLNLGGVASAVTGLAGGLGDGAKNVAGGIGNAASALGGHADDAIDGAKGGMKWLLPLLIVGALGFLAYWLTSKGCGKKNEASTSTGAHSGASTAATTAASGTTATAVMPTKDPTKVKLADGTEIDAFKGGIEDQLVTFLNNKGETLADVNSDKTKYWFDFDNLNFVFGKTELTEESKKQIGNLIAVMKAYPAFKFKIGCYTDRVGDDNANMTLSQKRADAVLAAIKAAGGDVSRIEKAEGYGETRAVVDEKASDAERLKDRRTAIRVLAK